MRVLIYFNKKITNKQNLFPINSISSNTIPGHRPGVSDPKGSERAGFGLSRGVSASNERKVFVYPMFDNKCYKNKKQKKHSYYYHYLLFTNKLSLNTKQKQNNIIDFGQDGPKRQSVGFWNLWCGIPMRAFGEKTRRSMGVDQKSITVKSTSKPGQSGPDSLRGCRTKVPAVNKMFLETVEDISQRDNFFSLYPQSSFFLKQSGTKNIAPGRPYPAAARASRGPLSPFGLKNPYRKSFLCYWLLPLIGFVSNSYSHQQYNLPNNTNNLLLISSDSVTDFFTVDRWGMSKGAKTGQSGREAPLGPGACIQTRMMNARSYMMGIPSPALYPDIKNLIKMTYKQLSKQSFNNNSYNQSVKYTGCESVRSTQVPALIGSPFLTKGGNGLTKCFLYLENLNSLLGLEGLTAGRAMARTKTNFSNNNLSGQALGVRSALRGASRGPGACSPEKMNKKGGLRHAFINNSHPYGAPTTGPGSKVPKGPFIPASYTVPFKGNFSLIHFASLGLQAEDRTLGTIDAQPSAKQYKNARVECPAGQAGQGHRYRPAHRDIYKIVPGLLKQNPVTSYTKASVLLDKYLSLNPEEKGLKRNFGSREIESFIKGLMDFYLTNQQADEINEKNLMGRGQPPAPYEREIPAGPGENYLTNNKQNKTDKKDSFSLLETWPGKRDTQTKPFIMRESAHGTLFNTFTVTSYGQPIDRIVFSSNNLKKVKIGGLGRRGLTEKEKIVVKKDKNELYLSILKSALRYQKWTADGILDVKDADISSEKNIFKLEYPIYQSNSLENLSGVGPGNGPPMIDLPIILRAPKEIRMKNRGALPAPDSLSAVSSTTSMDRGHAKGLNERNVVSLLKINKQTNERKMIFGSINLENDYYHLKNYLNKVDFSIWKKIPNGYFSIEKLNDHNKSGNKISELPQVKQNTRVGRASRLGGIFNIKDKNRTLKWNTERNTVLSFLNDNNKNRPPKYSEGIFLAGPAQKHKIEKLLRSYLSIKGNNDFSLWNKNQSIDTVNVIYGIRGPRRGSNQISLNKKVKNENISGPLRGADQNLTQNRETLARFLKEKLYCYRVATPQNKPIFRNLRLNKKSVYLAGQVNLGGLKLMPVNKNISTSFRPINRLYTNTRPMPPALRDLTELLSVQNGSSVHKKYAKPIYSPRLLIKNRLLFNILNEKNLNKTKHPDQPGMVGGCKAPLLSSNYVEAFAVKDDGTGGALLARHRSGGAGAAIKEQPLYGDLLWRGQLVKRKSKMKKRRIRKLKRENKNRTKRNRFYPRPVWLGNRLYQKFWKIRFNNQHNKSQQFHNYYEMCISPRIDKRISSQLSYLLFTPVIQSNEITSSVVRELKTVLSKPMLKKGPYRDLLSSYLKKVTISLNEIKKTTRTWELLKSLKYLMNSSILPSGIYGPRPLETSPAFLGLPTKVPTGKLKSLKSSSPPGTGLYRGLNNNKQTITNLSSYNEKVKKRIQLYVTQIRENLTLNGNIKVRSSHIYPLQTEEKGYFQNKNSSTLPLSSLIPRSLRLNPMSRLRLYWAFSKVNGGNRLGTVGKALERETYYNKKSDIWITATKAREQTKDNKTRKLLRDINKKFIIFINNEQKPLSRSVVPNNIKPAYSALSKTNKPLNKTNNYFNVNREINPIENQTPERLTGNSSGRNEKNQWNKLMLSKAISKTRLKHEKLSNLLIEDITPISWHKNRAQLSNSGYLNLIGRNSRHWWVMNKSFLKNESAAYLPLNTPKGLNHNFIMGTESLTNGYPITSEIQSNGNNSFGLFPRPVGQGSNRQNLDNSCYYNKLEKRNLFNDNTYRIDNIDLNKSSDVHQGVILNSILFHFCSIITLLCITQIRDFIKFTLIGMKKLFSVIITGVAKPLHHRPINTSGKDKVKSNTAEGPVILNVANNGDQNYTNGRSPSVREAHHFSSMEIKGRPRTLIGLKTLEGYWPPAGSNRQNQTQTVMHSSVRFAHPDFINNVHFYLKKSGLRSNSRVAKLAYTHIAKHPRPLPDLARPGGALSVDMNVTNKLELSGQGITPPDIKGLLNPRPDGQGSNRQKPNNLNFLILFYYLLRSMNKKTIYLFKDWNNTNEMKKAASVEGYRGSGMPEASDYISPGYGSGLGPLLPSAPAKLKNKTVLLYSLLTVNNITKALFSMYYTTKTQITTKQKQVKDLTQTTVRSVYTFLEKPGELIVDWIAYLFLVEWASDLTNILPFSFDNKVLGQPFYKLTRTVYSLNMVNTFTSFLLYKELNSSFNGNLSNFLVVASPANKSFGLNLDNLTLMDSTSIKTNSILSPLHLNNSFLSILGYLYSTRLQRGFYNFYSIFLQAFYQPDTDILYRQRKGIVFWDIWGDFLTATAEKNNINISELTSLKEEQIKLLSAVENGSSIAKEKPAFLPFTNFKELSKIKERSLGLASAPGEPAGSPPKNKGEAPAILSLFTRLINNFGTGAKQKQINEGQYKSFGSSSLLFKNFNRAKNIHSPLKEKNQTPTDYLFVNNLSLNNNYKNLGYFYEYKNDVNNIFYNDKGKTWGSQQFLSYAFGKKDIELFIDLHPPTSLVRLFGPNPNSPLRGLMGIPSPDRENTNFKKDSILQGTIGPLVCQIFSGTFTNIMSKNILVIGSNNTGMYRSQRDKSLQKTLLVQAIAGETELKIITDNAHRYALVYRGVAVGIKLLRDVFDSLSLQSPCIFLLEDIHAIGEKRSLLISDDDNSNSHSGKAQNVEIHEKNQVLYQLSKHVITHYKKPYKGDYSLLIPSNHFCFSFFSMKERGIEGISSTLRLRQRPPLKVNELSSNKEENKEKNTTSILPSRLLKPSSIHLAPPATSPFSVLTLKEEKKFQINKNVLEMPWGVAGSSITEGSSLNAVSKAAYSIRVKVALLADMALSSLTIKLDMITDLLVIIDSVKGNRGFVVFATTHIPSILDPALRRPGRLDETISLTILRNQNNEHQNTSLLSITKYSDGIFNDPTVNGTLGYVGGRGLHRPAITKNEFNNPFNFRCFKTSRSAAPIKKYSFKLSSSEQSHILLHGPEGPGHGSTPLQSIFNSSKKKLLSQVYVNACLELSSTAIITPNVGNTGLYKQIEEGKNSTSIVDRRNSIPHAYPMAERDNNVSLFDYTLLKTRLKDKWYLYGNTITLKTNLSLLISIRFVSEFLVFKKLTTITPFIGNILNKGNTNLSLNDNVSINWRSVVSLALSFVHKRIIYNQTLIIPKLPTAPNSTLYTPPRPSAGDSPALLDFTNNNSLISPPSPPISNILLPAKRYENYKRSFAYLKDKTKESPGGNTNIMQKINYQSQQRLVKRLYGIPLKESFKSELIEKRLTNFSNAAFMIGGPRMTPSLFQKPTNSNWFVRNRILKRHQNYLTNQWWNCQLPEYNAETTFLSDIDWRYTFVSSIGGPPTGAVGDILLDFPDAEQYYNPRNRRWEGFMIPSKNTFSGFTGHTSENKLSSSSLYSHFIYDSIIKAFNTYEQNREILDYYAYSISNTGTLVTETMSEISRLTQRKRFFR